MGVGHQQAVDEVFFFDTRRRFTFTATTLGFVVGQRLILHVALMRKGHDNIFLVDQVFNVDIRAVRGDLGTTRVAELFTDQLQLFADNFHQAIGAAQNVQQFRDLFQQLFVFIEQFFMLKAGQLLQTQIQNRLRLLFSQVVLAVAYAELGLQPFRTGGVIAGAFQHRGNVAQIP